MERDKFWGTWYGTCKRNCGRVEPMAVPFVMVNGVDPRNRVFGGRAHWRHLANTVERLCAEVMNGSATWSGDVACSRITLGNFIADKVRRQSRAQENRKCDIDLMVLFRNK